MTSTTPLRINPRLLEVLDGEDELGMVVRAHIHLEAQLTELLRRLLPYPAALADMNLRYAQRVHLATALGLKAQFRSPLLALGKLRNDFAHEPATTLSRVAVNKLYSSLSDEERTLVKASYHRIKRGLSTSDAVPFDKLTPKDKFVLIAVAMEAMFAVALNESHRRKAGRS